MLRSSRFLQDPQEVQELGYGGIVRKEVGGGEHREEAASAASRGRDALDDQENKSRRRPAQCPEAHHSAGRVQDRTRPQAFPCSGSGKDNDDAATIKF